jgi:hypothetical protein
MSNKVPQVSNIAIEPATGVLAVVGAKLAYDVLGPTAKYLGGEFKGLAEIGVKNVKRVFEAAKKRKDQLGIHKGCVPPRLLRPILQSAFVCDDEIIASYLGGVLCSATSSNHRDDRAVSLLKMGFVSFVSFCLRNSEPAPNSIRGLLRNLSVLHS